MPALGGLLILLVIMSFQNFEGIEDEAIGASLVDKIIPLPLTIKARDYIMPVELDLIVENQEVAMFSMLTCTNSWSRLLPMLFFVVSLLFPWCIFSQKQDLIIPIPKPLTKRFYKLPVLVETVRQKSIVGIRVIIPRFNYGNNSSGPHSFINVGIVAKDDGIIITSAHTFGESQAEWYHENTSVFVYDESRAFTAKLIDLDPEADLAKIKIENLNEHMPPFSKKAALFATQREKELISDFKNFYSFGF
jgi:S1-C subfamily serine protease